MMKLMKNCWISQWGIQLEGKARFMVKALKVQRIEHLVEHSMMI